MQAVENTCIGHEISLRKISEPLALKALDFTTNSTTTRNAVVEARCGTDTAKGAQEPRVCSRLLYEQNFLGPAQITQTVMCRHTRGLFQSISYLRAHMNTRY